MGRDELGRGGFEPETAFTGMGSIDQQITQI